MRKYEITPLRIDEKVRVWTSGERFLCTFKVHDLDNLYKYKLEPVYEIPKGVFAPNEHIGVYLYIRNTIDYPFWFKTFEIDNIQVKRRGRWISLIPKL